MTVRHHDPQFRSQYHYPSFQHDQSHLTPLLCGVGTSSSSLDGSSLGSGFLLFAGSSGAGGGVFALGGVEAGAASGSSGVATGGTTTPEESGALVVELSCFKRRAR